MEIAIRCALRRQPVKVRRLESLRTKHADVCVALIVGEDDDDVRTGVRGWNRIGFGSTDVHPKASGPDKREKFRQEHFTAARAVY
jgi:hypothetical protein